VYKQQQVFCKVVGNPIVLDAELNDPITVGNVTYVPQFKKTEAA
jgi:hypothetical protein